MPKRSWIRTLIAQTDSFGETNINGHVFVAPLRVKDQLIYVRILPSGHMIGEIIGYTDELSFPLTLKKMIPLTNKGRSAATDRPEPNRNTGSLLHEPRRKSLPPFRA